MINQLLVLNLLLRLFLIGGAFIISLVNWLAWLRHRTLADFAVAALSLLLAVDFGLNIIVVGVVLTEGENPLLIPLLTIQVTALLALINVIGLAVNWQFRKAGLILKGLFASEQNLIDQESQRIRQLEYLLATNKTVIYAFHHDLRGPLRTAAGFVDIALESVEGNDEAIEHLQTARTEMERIESLLTALSRWSKLDDEPMESRRFNVKTLLEAVMNGHREQIRLRFADYFDLRGDFDLLTSVVQNLIDNGLKYGQGQAVEIGGESRADDWLLWVRDRGPGIKPEYQESIFEPFRRLDRQSGRGAGLGLSIAKRIIDRHCGRIWVESEPGEGAAFFFSIPKY